MKRETKQQEIVERIYMQYHKLMLKVAFDVLQNPDDAQDAVQQAYVQLLMNQDRIAAGDTARLRCYVTTTAHNCAVDLCRKRNNDRALLYVFCEGHVDEISARMIDVCILQLSEKYRNVLRLKHEFGYSSSETAKILRLSEANVDKINQRAKKKLEVVCRDAHLL